jgi:hypothetical protein
LVNKLKHSSKYQPFDLIHIIGYAIPLLFIITFFLGQFNI